MGSGPKERLAGANQSVRKLETKLSQTTDRGTRVGLDNTIVFDLETVTFLESMWTKVTVEMMAYEAARTTNILNDFIT